MPSDPPAPADEAVDLQITYRLQWDMPSLDQMSRLENHYGADVWDRASEDDLNKLTWHHHEQVGSDLAPIADRRAILEMWKAARICPVRNLKFERRTPNYEWEEVM